MKVYTNLVQFPKNETNDPITLTIGTFDGVHLGHQDILKEIVQTTNSCLVTFRTPPSHILQKNEKGLVTTIEHKLSLLKKFGVSCVYLLDFTPQLAQTSPEDFLSALHRVVPFSHLFLGYDACIGHKRTGTPSVIEKISEKMNFALSYLPPRLFNGQIISSSVIREQVQKADFSLLKSLLGREYSISSTPVQGAGFGKKLGYPTLNFEVDQLITPPFGVWICETVIDGKYFPSLANLGIAPTFHEKRSALLEVHLLSPLPVIQNMVIEVIFRKYLRKEQKFEDGESLKKQIMIDELQAIEFFSTTQNHDDGSKCITFDSKSPR